MRKKKVMNIKLKTLRNLMSIILDLSVSFFIGRIKALNKDDW